MAEQQEQQQQGGGYDFGLAASSSSGASQSGAIRSGGGGNFAGTNYGPGSLILTDQRGSVGANAGASPSGITLALIGGAALVAVFLLKKL